MGPWSLLESRWARWLRQRTPSFFSLRELLLRRSGCPWLTATGICSRSPGSWTTMACRMLGMLSWHTAGGSKANWDSWEPCSGSPSGLQMAPRSPAPGRSVAPALPGSRPWRTSGAAWPRPPLARWLSAAGLPWWPSLASCWRASSGWSFWPAWAAPGASWRSPAGS